MNATQKNMSGVSAFLLTYSSLLCASFGGVYAYACCALLCLFLCFPVPLYPKTLPRWLGFLPALSLVLRLSPLLQTLLPELGPYRTPGFFGVLVAVLVCLSLGKNQLLPRASLPLAFLAVVCGAFCLFGTFAPVLSPSRTLAGRLFPLCAALLCPLSGALLLPSVGMPGKDGTVEPPRLRTLLFAVVAAAVCALPVLLFDGRFWAGGALLFACPLCAAAEARALFGKHV